MRNEIRTMFDRFCFGKIKQTHLIVFARSMDHYLCVGVNNTFSSENNSKQPKIYVLSAGSV